MLDKGESTGVSHGHASVDHATPLSQFAGRHDAKKMRILARLLLLLMVSGCRQHGGPELTVREHEIQPHIKPLRIGRTTAYYVFSNLHVGPKEERLPAIIFLGHPAPEIRPVNHFSLVWGKFREPVVLIWSGILDGLTEAELNTPVEDRKNWRRNSELFPKLVEQYVEALPVDPDRIYLTGFSASGVHAWMLAYDRPELYAGVVAMSAVAYPPQIQENLDSSARVVTVVVRAEQDLRNKESRNLEGKTGSIIEARNPNSRWIVKEGETHAGVKRHWPEYLNYILQFSKTRVGRVDDLPLP